MNKEITITNILLFWPSFFKKQPFWPFFIRILAISYEKNLATLGSTAVGQNNCFEP